MPDRESPITQRRMPLSSATREEPAVGNGHGPGRDAREDTPNEAFAAYRPPGSTDPRDLADEELTRRALEAIPTGQSPAQYARLAAVFSFKSAEHSAASFEAAGGALREARDVREYVQRLVENRELQHAAIPPARPPLPSQTEMDLEVIDTTKDGTPIYKASAPQMQAVRETERRHAMAEFAVGEEQRANERIRIAVEAALKAQADRNDARPYRFLRDDLTPALTRASLIALVLAIGAAIGTAAKAAFAFLTRH